MTTNTDKPTGRWQCVVCGETWDGSQLYRDTYAYGVVWTCGNLFCGARVVKVQEQPTTTCPSCGDPITADDAVIDGQHSQCAEAGAEIGYNEAKDW